LYKEFDCLPDDYNSQQPEGINFYLNTNTNTNEKSSQNLFKFDHNISEDDNDGLSSYISEKDEGSIKLIAEQDEEHEHEHDGREKDDHVDNDEHEDEHEDKVEVKDEGNDLLELVRNRNSFPSSKKIIFQRALGKNLRTTKDMSSKFILTDLNRLNLSKKKNSYQKLEKIELKVKTSRSSVKSSFSIPNVKPKIIAIDSLIKKRLDKIEMKKRDNTYVHKFIYDKNAEFNKKYSKKIVNNLINNDVKVVKKGAKGFSGYLNKGITGDETKRSENTTQGTQTEISSAHLNIISSEKYKDTLNEETDKIDSHISNINSTFTNLCKFLQESQSLEEDDDENDKDHPLYLKTNEDVMKFVQNSPLKLLHSPSKLIQNSPSKGIFSSPKKNSSSFNPLINEVIGKFANDISVGFGLTQKLKVDQSRIAEMVKDLLKECELLISDNEQLRDKNDILTEKNENLKETYTEIFETLVNSIIDTNDKLYNYLRNLQTIPKTEKEQKEQKEQSDYIESIILDNVNIIERGNYKYCISYLIIILVY